MIIKKLKNITAGTLILLLQIISFAPIQAQASVSMSRVGDSDTCTTHVQSFVSDGSEIDIATDLNVVTSYTDSRHTAVIDQATWVWPTEKTVDAKNGETQTIARDFTIIGDPMGASLEIAVDNTYKVSINGNLIGEDDDSSINPGLYGPGEEIPYNFTASGQDTYAVPANFLKTGVNTIVIEATNWSSSFNTPEVNPAGLMYSLEVTSQECSSVCELSVTSDTSASSHSSTGGAVSAYTDSRHTAVIDQAEWIWTTNKTIDAKNGETQEFSRTFAVEGDNMTSAILEIAADNAYTVTINGNEFGDDDKSIDPGQYGPGQEVPYNFTASGQDLWDISNIINMGMNTIHFKVTNWSSSFNTPEVNPAGLMYSIKVQTEMPGNDCETENHPPVITVIGDNPMTISQDSLFVDPGAIANDMEDGDITVNIELGGDTVDTTTPGTYIITYNVMDSEGLSAAQKTRTVIVEPAQVHVCSLEFVSEAGTTFADSIEGTPVVEAWDESPAWTAEEVIPNATWVWKTEFTQDPLNGETIDFYRNINIPGDIVSASAKVGADNRYKLFVNGNQESSDSIYADYYNFEKENIQTLDVASALSSGDNNLHFLVRQNSSSGSGETGNPAGLIYNLTVNYETTEACDNVINMPPVITVEPEMVTLALGDTFDIKQGVTAQDDFDGDITSDIETGGDVVDFNTPGTYIITYNVMDSEGLSAAQKTRTIVVLPDNTNLKPEITVDPEIVTVVLGDVYSVTTGVTANDNEDGDITIDIEVSGDTLDTNTLGSYVIKYDVKDSEGLEADQKTRTINVVNDPNVLGSINICSILLDENGNVVTNTNNGEDFEIKLYNEKGMTTLLSTSLFTTPMTSNTDLLGNDLVNDATCIQTPDMSLGKVYYDQVIAKDDSNSVLGYVSGLSDFEQPLYNDNVNVSNFDLGKVYEYSPELFDTNPANNATRNKKSDGLVKLTASKPNKTLVVVNQIASQDNGEIPEITVDPEIIQIFVGDTVDTKTGVNATDFEDGDLTDVIAVGGDTVDTNTVGSYTVTYNVTDSDGNDAVEKSRTYVVFKKPTTLTCNEIDGNGWYAQYFNHKQSHPDMDPSSNDNFGDPKSVVETWTTDWYDIEYYRFDQIESDLEFGSNFFPFDGSDYEEEINNGHEFYFGGYYQAKVTVPTSGNYAVNYSSDDDMWVYVDGVLAIDNSGVHLASNKNDVLALSGEHMIEVFYADRKEDQAALNLSFVSPDVTVEAINQKCIVPDEIPVITVDPEIVTLTTGDSIPTNLDILDGVTAEDVEDGDITVDIIPSGDTITPDDIENQFQAALANDTALNLTQITAIHSLLSSFGWPTGGLTVNQINSIIALTNSFGADASTINSLNALLNGQGILTLANLGTHTINYDVTDSAGNDAVQKSRTYNVVSNEIPVITVDPEIVTLIIGAPTPDIRSGVTADDFEDGNITIDIDTSGDVIDTSTAGTYTVTYDVTDSNGNNARSVSRIYVVTTDEIPVITVIPENITLKVGDFAPIPPNRNGVTASDLEDGDITGSLRLSTDRLFVFDSLRLIMESDPILTAIQIDSILSLTESFRYKLDEGFTIVQLDALGSLLDSFGADASTKTQVTTYLSGPILLDSNHIGTHTITYDVTDSDGNDAVQKSRTYTVVTNEIPVITVDPETVTVNIGAPAPNVLAGVTASDFEDGDITVDVQPVGIVDTNTVGSYTVTYNVTDSDGNDAVEKSRTYVVKSGGGGPGNIPVILVDPVTITLTIGSSAPDTKAGVTADDVEDGDLTSVITTGGDIVDTNTLGTYSVTYDVTDSNGNNAVQKTRTYIIEPLQGEGNPPVITLVGDNPMVIYVTNTFVDPGATATDIEDGDITADITVGGDTVVTNQPNFFTITYNVMDSDGNSATEVTREVEVRRVGGGCSGNCGGTSPNTKPVITLEGDNPLQLVKGQFFAEPGFVANDNEDGVITPDVIISGDTVDTDTVGTYVINYNVSDSKGLAADQVSRTVVVGEVLGETAVFPNCQLRFEKHLQFGDRGEEVRDVQSWLNEFFGLSIAEDGIYGPETAAAVGYFQSRDAYAPIVLTPWGYQKSTDRWYKTTKALANHLNDCDEPENYLEDVGRYWETTDEHIGWVDEK